MKRQGTISLSCWGLALGLAACNPELSVDLNDCLAEPETCQVEEEIAKEGITPANDPSLFSANLERRFSALPLRGEAKRIPWAGSYWPTYMDSINVKWAGPSSLSAVAKYGKAFGISKLEDRISASAGIDSQLGQKACARDSECDAALGEVCAKRTGRSRGLCIPTWFGQCHAWAPAAILEPEPIHPVKYKGVPFQVNDIKALLTYVYNAVDVRFLGERCDLSRAANDISLDTAGRPLPPECRDTNPGSFHIVMANFLGRMGRSFVEDRTFDAEVWNQPMRGYEILEQRGVTAKEANQLLGLRDVGGTDKSLSGTLAQGQQKAYGPYTLQPGSVFQAKLSLKNDRQKAELFIRFFKNNPEESRFVPCNQQSGGQPACSYTVGAGAPRVQLLVKALTAKASYRLKLRLNGRPAADYAFNPAAAQLVYVRMQAKYISESSLETDGNLGAYVDEFTLTDLYGYVLEQNAAGEIIGGEWAGLSKLNHPDFLWLPIKQNSPQIDGISYKAVLELLKRSRQ